MSSPEFWGKFGVMLLKPKHTELISESLQWKAAYAFSCGIRIIWFQTIQS